MNTGMNELSQKIGIDGIDLQKILNFLPYPLLVSESRENVRHNIFLNRKFLEEIGYAIEEIPTIEDWFVKAYPDAMYRETVRKEWLNREILSSTTGQDYILSRAYLHTRNNGDRWYEVKAMIYGSIRFVAFVNIDEEINREIELKRLNENKDLMLSVLGHDLRAPLHNLYSILQLTLENELTEDEKAQSLRTLTSQVFQMLELLDLTLQWTRSNFETAKTQQQQVNVQDITDEVLAIYQDAIRRKKLTVKTHLSKKLVTGDPAIWSIVIRNIISNAVKFTPSEGNIGIHDECVNGKHIFSVTNSGVSITKEKIEKIQHRTYNSERGTSGEKGLGLGLKLCQQLLEKVDGKLEIAGVDSGTVVRIVSSEQ